MDGAQVGAREVGGQGRDPVGGGCGIDGGLVAGPVDGGPCLCIGAGGDLQEWCDLGAEDLGDAGVDLLEGLVVAAAKPVADLGQCGLGLDQGPFAGIGDRGLFFGRVDERG